MNSFEKGQLRAGQVYGEKSNELLGPLLGSAIQVAPELVNYMLEFAQGDIYTRSGLSDKDRELAITACLIGKGLTNEILEAHFIGMLRCGWTPHEIAEILLSLIPNIGFPQVIEAMRCAQKAISLMTSDRDSNNLQHKN